MSDVYAFIDFETTGLDPAGDYPVEVAVIWTDEQLAEIARYESLIACMPVVDRCERAAGRGGGYEWPEEWREAAAVHGLSAHVVTQQGLPAANTALNAIHCSLPPDGPALPSQGDPVDPS